MLHLYVLMKEYKTDSITELFNMLVDDKLDNNFETYEKQVS
jgi:hypothetical protein